MENWTATDYPLLVSRCTTQNSLHRLHIDIERIATPEDIAIIASEPDLSARSRAWLDELCYHCPDLVSNPRGYLRRNLSPHSHFYEATRATPLNRSLLIGFTGNAGRLMLPLPLFLQFLPPDRWDLVLLRRTGIKPYLLGMDGIAGDLLGVISHVRDGVAGRAYQSVVAFGVSAGGHPAIAAAHLIRADGGVSIAGRLPALGSPQEAALHALGEISRFHPGPDLQHVYSANFQPDSVRAAAMLDRYGGRLVPVPGVDIHGPLAPLMRRGQITGFLAELLGRRLLEMSRPGRLV